MLKFTDSQKYYQKIGNMTSSPDVRFPPQHQETGLHLGSVSEGSSADDRTDEQKKKDKELAEHLSLIIEEANKRVVPLVKMIRKVSKRVT